MLRKLIGLAALTLTTALAALSMPNPASAISAPSVPSLESAPSASVSDLRCIPPDPDLVRICHEFSTTGSETWVTIGFGMRVAVIPTKWRVQILDSAVNDLVVDEEFIFGGNIGTPPPDFRFQCGLAPFQLFVVGLEYRGQYIEDVIYCPTTSLDEPLQASGQ